MSDEKKAAVSGQAVSFWTQLPKVVVAHATFQNALSGEPPSEAALAYPIQMYLSMKAKLAIILAEQDHPGIGSDGKLGRPFQIDFVGIDRRYAKADGPKKWSWALETKLFDGSKRDRVVRDIVKLLLLLETGGRYMLLLCPAKPQARLRFAPDFSTAHHEIHRATAGKEKPANLFDVLLPWTTDRPKFVVLDKLHSQLIKEFEKARNEFDAPPVRPSFKIKLIAKDRSDDFVCGLWQILL